MAKAQLSNKGAVIKAAYEGQPDTNCLTDARAAKLDAITNISSLVVVTTTPKNLVAADMGKHFTNSGANVEIIFNEPSSDTPIGSIIEVSNMSAYGCQFVADESSRIRDGETLSNTGAALKLTDQGSIFKLQKIAASLWMVVSGVGARQFV